MKKKNNSIKLFNSILLPKYDTELYLETLAQTEQLDSVTLKNIAAQCQIILKNASQSRFNNHFNDFVNGGFDDEFIQLEETQFFLLTNY